MPGPTQQLALHTSASHHPLVAVRFGTGVVDVIALAVQADDEHGAPVDFAAWLGWCQDGRFAAAWSYVADALAEAAAAEFIRAAKELDGVVGAERGDAGLHGAVMLVAEGKHVGPHRE